MTPSAIGSLKNASTPSAAVVARHGIIAFFEAYINENINAKKSVDRNEYRNSFPTGKSACCLSIVRVGSPILNAFETKKTSPKTVSIITANLIRYPTATITPDFSE